MNRAMLGNGAGTIGYVFSEYPDFDNAREKGIQIIFKNGCLDGFSYQEQGLYLEFLEIVEEYSTYQFQNVGQVFKDWIKSYWNFDA